MKHSLCSAVCALALLSAGVTVVSAPEPAYAQSDVSFGSFHDELARYGDWVYSDRWGEVWLPDVSADFQPYGTDGYWANTDDYGWTWVSDYPWGDVAFHYGRWVDDPDDGWMWIPGYVWSPAWVVWRSNDQVTGWMPMPPDDQFLSGGLNISGGGLSFSINYNDPGDYYGYRDWYGPSYGDDRFAGNWIFVGTDHFADRDFRRYERPRAENMTVIRNTTNITNYKVVNNIIVNKSVDARAVSRASGHQVQAVRANTVMHNPNLITHVDQGRRAQESAHAAMPHGTGAAGSAPRPTAAVVNSLSGKVPQRRGQASSHVFTRQTVEQAPLGNRAATPAAATQDQQRDQRSGDQPRQDQQRQDQLRQEQQRGARPAQAAPNAPQPEQRAPQPAAPKPQQPPQQEQRRQEQAAPQPDRRPPAEPAQRPQDRREPPQAKPAPTPDARAREQAAPTPNRAPPAARPEPQRPEQPRQEPQREAPRAQPPRPTPPPAARPEQPHPQPQPGSHPPPKKDEDKKDEPK